MIQGAQAAGEGSVGPEQANHIQTGSQQNGDADGRKLPGTKRDSDS